MSRLRMSCAASRVRWSPRRALAERERIAARPRREPQVNRVAGVGREMGDLVEPLPRYGQRGCVTPIYGHGDGAAAMGRWREHDVDVLRLDVGVDRRVGDGERLVLADRPVDAVGEV